MTHFDDFLPELVEIRHKLHRHPELGLAEVETADLVAGYLESWGFEVTRGLGQTGIVGTLRRGTSGCKTGLRAELDALPIAEETGLPYASAVPGRMHACGHDGHMAMLLGAGWLLAHDAEFDGTVHLIFQPAEETDGGGQMMIEDGLFERFPCDRVFALHNFPGLEAGRIAVRAGAMCASIDAVTVTVRGQGGHGAFPEECVDPVVAASAIVMALQTVVARSVSPHLNAVVTVGSIHGGSASNIIPDAVTLEISLRATDPDLRIRLRDRLCRICEDQAQSFGATVGFEWHTGYPAAINDGGAVRELRSAVVDVLGADRLEELAAPMMGSEDFSFLLEKVPGAYAFIGNGDSAGLHTAGYDFNDDLLPVGARLLHRLASHGPVLEDRR